MTLNILVALNISLAMLLDRRSFKPVFLWIQLEKLKSELFSGSGVLQDQSASLLEKEALAGRV